MQSVKHTALAVPRTASLNRNTPRCEHWEKRAYGFELMTDDPVNGRSFRYVCELCVPVTGMTTIFR